MSGEVKNDDIPSRSESEAEQAVESDGVEALKSFRMRCV